jgi:hypothetical protein
MHPQRVLALRSPPGADVSPPLPIDDILPQMMLPSRNTPGSAGGSHRRAGSQGAVTAADARTYYNGKDPAGILLA